MSVTSPSFGVSRLAIATLTGVTALSLAACGSSSETKPAPSSNTASAPTSSTPPASGKGKDWVKGLINSVSSSAIQVAAKSGPTTVDFTPSTKIAEITPAQLTDVTPGSCVWVHPDHHADAPANGPVEARGVSVSPAVDGKCPGPTHPAGDKPNHQPPPHGQVASVAGNTITLNSTDAQGNSSSTTVNVTDTTKYTKKTPTDAHAIAQGRCLVAHGSRDGSGALQATNINVQDAVNGSCPEHGGKHHDR